MTNNEWPPEPGRYNLGDKQSCVAVCTLSEVNLELQMENIAIAGKCVTENIGIEKIIKNVIANGKIRFMILCCNEPEGHYVGQAFFCLKKDGIDNSRRIIGAKGAMPFLKNVTDEEIARFNEQVELIDMIGEEDPKKIAEKAKELLSKNPGAFGSDMVSTKVEIIKADYDVDKNATADSGLDEDWFTVTVDRQNKQIVVEQYNGHGKDEKLVRKIVGTRAEQIAGTIARLGLPEGKYHSIYLGKELEKAEIALKTGKDYEQDRGLE